MEFSLDPKNILKRPVDFRINLRFLSSQVQKLRLILEVSFRQSLVINKNKLKQQKKSSNNSSLLENIKKQNAKLAWEFYRKYIRWTTVQIKGSETIYLKKSKQKNMFLIIFSKCISLCTQSQVDQWWCKQKMCFEGIYRIVFMISHKYQ